MEKEILISATHLETRVAILEKVHGGHPRLTDFFTDMPDKQKIVGNIYKGRIKNILPGLNSAFVDIGFGKNAYLQIDDVVPHTKKLQSALKANSDIMVQVTKESIGTKGPKITMNLSLTGRFFVLMPFSNKLGVSKNITDKSRRAHLKEFAIRYLKEKNLSYGGIFRSESEDATDEELKDEIRYLDRVFKMLLNKFNQVKSPRTIYSDLDVTQSIIRDYFIDEVKTLLTDSQEIFDSALEYVSDVAPELKDRIKLYKNKTPLFVAFNIEKEIENLLLPRVKLATGGYIIIQEAESLCAIDVNSGKYVGGSLEETVTQTNIAAAHEIARHLRLRNIGGIIVTDFIDMKNRTSQRKVLDTLSEAVKSDKARVKIFPVTNLGLIEMSRSRKSPSLRAMMGETCPCCKGGGMVLSKHSVFVKVNSELQKFVPKMGIAQRHSGFNLRLKLNPEVADYFIEKKKRLCADVNIVKDSSLEYDEYQIIME